MSKYYMRNGYVLYDRLLNSNQGPRTALWNKIGREGTIDSIKFTSQAKFINNISQISQYLIDLGNFEQQKEINILKELGLEIDSNTLSNPNEMLIYIKKINELIGISKDFQLLLSELQKVDGTKGERAPLPFSYFESYLGTTLNRMLTAYIKSADWETAILTGNFDSQIEHIKKDIFPKAIQNTINHISKQEAKHNKDEYLWTNIKNLLKKISKLQKQQFIDEVYSRYQLDSIIPELITFSQNKYEENKLTNVYGIRKNTIDKTLKGDPRKMSGIAGLLSEYIPNNPKLELLVNLNNGSIKTTHFTFGNNKMATDSVTLYSYESLIKLEQLGDEMNKYFKGTSSLKDARARMEKFYDDTLSKLNNTFIIYESTKAYTPHPKTSSFKGFGGSEGKIQDLIPILNDMDLQVKGDELCGALYNAIPGALGNLKYDVNTIKSDIEEALAGAFAYVMFDDWQTIGTPHDKIIHMLNLTGVYVPLSYFLLTAGKAMQQMDIKTLRKCIDFNITQGGTIKFSTPAETTKWINDNNSNIDAAWDEQRQDAIKNTTYSLHFMKNFNDLINQLIDTY